MKRNSFVIAVTLAVVLLIVTMTLDVYQNVKKDFYEVYTRNSLLIESKLTKLTDLLEFNGRRANRLINNVNLYIEMEQEKYDKIYEYFEYDENRDIFHLDNIQNHGCYGLTINNITGAGNLDFLNDKDSLKFKEIGLALLLNADINSINEKVESNEWVYYTSLNEFVILKNRDLTFVDSNKFYYYKEMLDREFITKGAKDVLKDRESIFWTEPYVDMGEEYVIVTTSYPVDYEGEYIGALSIDFKTSALNTLLDDDYSSFLLNDDGTIIATNVKDINIFTELIQFNELNYNITFEDLETASKNNFNRVNGSRVASTVIEGTPYTLYQIYFASDATMEYVVKLLPVVICLILFVVINIAYKRIAKSESTLKETLYQLKESKKELDYLANYDTLTNVLNRRGLYRELKDIDKDSSNIIILDVDHFKKINDKYGHDIGDKVLEKVSKVISNYISETDIIARYGGEEFVIVLKDKTLNESVGVAEGIRIIVEESFFDEVGKVTISLGVASLDNNLTQEECIKKADLALYKSKESGRNMVTYYDDIIFNTYSKKK